MESVWERRHKSQGIRPNHNGVRIAYPREQYEDLLDYFQFSDLSYSDFIPEEYETEPIAGYGFPPPRYAFSFISKEMDLAVV